MTMAMVVNLPVGDLDVSRKFFSSLGFAFDPAFADESMEAMIINEHCHVMLLATAYFQSYTPKPIADAAVSTEAILALAVESRTHVDSLVEAALAAGAKPARDTTDLGFVYQRSFQDPDGHIWEAFHLDPTAGQQE